LPAWSEGSVCSLFDGLPRKTTIPRGRGHFAILEALRKEEGVDDLPPGLGDGANSERPGPK